MQMENFNCGNGKPTEPTRTEISALSVGFGCVSRCVQQVESRKMNESSATGGALELSNDKFTFPATCPCHRSHEFMMIT